jgi:predicted phosphate transport protein (TIGR00153 family)
MFGRLLPFEGRFFDLFNALAGEAVRASRELASLMESFDDIERRAFAIESIEKRGDKITHETIELLHKTFVTPLDRDDIHHLVTRMDDILDLIEDCAQSISLYDVRSPTPEMKRLAEICVGCAEKVQAGVGGLSNLRDPRATMAVCADIDKLESEADRVMRAAIAKLFREEPDAKQIIKLRSIYELLETITDRCEDVANIIEGIVLENA